MRFDHRPEQTEAQAGFTLVEMLVAMVLLGFISIALLGGLRFEGRVWNRASQQSVELEEFFSFQALVRREYSNRSLIDTSSVDVPKFSGGRTSFEFLTFRSLPGVPAGLSVFETGISRPSSVNKAQLYLRWSNLPDDKTSQSSTDKGDVFRIFLEDAESVSFSYFGRPTNSDVSVWQETWSNPSSFPELIKISFARRDNDRNWPEIILSRGPGAL